MTAIAFSLLLGLFLTLGSADSSALDCSDYDGFLQVNCHRSPDAN
jgi:hypothetical protein